MNCIYIKPIIESPNRKKHQRGNLIKNSKVYKNVETINETIMFGLESFDYNYRVMIYDLFKNQKISFNDHSKAVTKENFVNDEYLKSNFTILGMSTDSYNESFISVIESNSENGRNIFATQFHSEKISFEFGSNYKHLNHNLTSLIGNQYFAQFFVQIAKMSNNNSMNWNDYTSSVIYNYLPYYTAKNTSQSYFEQTYIFFDQGTA